MAGFGLILARTQGMEGITGNLNEFPVDAGAGAIYRGDPVAATNGTITAYVAGDTNPIWGVFGGVRYTAPDGDTVFANYWDGQGAGRTNIVAWVGLPTGMTYHAKVNAALGSATQAGVAIGFVDLTTTPGDANLGGASRAVLDQSTAGAGPVMIHRLADLPGNAWDNPEPIVEVSVVLQQGTYADA